MANYTKDDFTSAQFAKQEDGRLATRDAEDLNHDFPWRAAGDGFVSDERMALLGWTPIKEAKTVYDSDVGNRCGDDCTDDYLMGYVAGFQDAGGTILDDPEVTLRQQLKTLIYNEWGVTDDVNRITQVILNNFDINPKSPEKR